MLVILAIAVIVLLLFLRTLKASPNGKTTPTTQPGQIPDLIRSAITSGGYSDIMAECWVAVSKMETAGWKSNLFTNNKNLWGMKVAHQRLSTMSNYKSAETWAKYNSVSDSANDIVLYMNARKYPKAVTDIEQLVAIMYDKSYFVGETYESYLNKVKAWL